MFLLVVGAMAWSATVGCPFQGATEAAEVERPDVWLAAEPYGSVALARAHHSAQSLKMAHTSMPLRLTDAC